jgi:hypothetical protein
MPDKCARVPLAADVPTPTAGENPARQEKIRGRFRSTTWWLSGLLADIRQPDGHGRCVH